MTMNAALPADLHAKDVGVIALEAVSHHSLFHRSHVDIDNAPPTPSLTVRSHMMSVMILCTPLMVKSHTRTIPSDTLKRRCGTDRNSVFRVSLGDQFSWNNYRFCFTGSLKRGVEIGMELDCVHTYSTSAVRRLTKRALSLHPVTKAVEVFGDSRKSSQDRP